MREQILIFAVKDEETKRRIARALMPLHIRVRAVPEEDWSKTVGEIAGIKKEERRESDNAAEPLTDPMMVLAGLSSARLDAVLAALRKNSVVLPYKAVLTEANAGWTPAALLAELRKEHEAMRSGK